MISDLIELAALACLAIAAFVIVALPGVLIVAGIELLYLSRVYGDRPLPKLQLPKLRKLSLPQLKRGS